MLRNSLRQIIFADAHRLVDVPQRVFRFYFILFLTQQNANGWIVVGLFNLTINGRKVKIKFTRIFWFKFPGFQLDGHITAQVQVIE